MCIVGYIVKKKCQNLDWCITYLSIKSNYLAKFVFIIRSLNIPKHILARESIPLNLRPIWTFDMASGLASNLMIYQGCKQSSKLNTNTKAEAYIGLGILFIFEHSVFLMQYAQVFSTKLL